MITRVEKFLFSITPPLPVGDYVMWMGGLFVLKIGCSLCVLWGHRRHIVFPIFLLCVAVKVRWHKLAWRVASCDRDRSVAVTWVAAVGPKLVCVGSARCPSAELGQVRGCAISSRARVYARLPTCAFRLQRAYKFPTRSQLYAAAPTRHSWVEWVHKSVGYHRPSVGA